jgi:hypothetical protein
MSRSLCASSVGSPPADELRALTFAHGCHEFAQRRDGMIHAMDGGLWLHRHVWKGTPMVHLVSTDRARLLAYGAALGLAAARLQFKPLKDPRNGVRREAWHWDLVGALYPPKDERLFSLRNERRAASHER